jgi:hypothetical protein
LAGGSAELRFRVFTLVILHITCATLQCHAQLRHGDTMRILGLATAELPIVTITTNGPGWNRTTARSFEGCRSIR